MTIVTRRNFLASAGTCSLFPSIPFSRWSLAHAELADTLAADEDKLQHDCIFARMEGNRLTLCRCEREKPFTDALGPGEKTSPVDGSSAKESELLTGVRL